MQHYNNHNLIAFVSFVTTRDLLPITSFYELFSNLRVTLLVSFSHLFYFSVCNYVKIYAWKERQKYQPNSNAPVTLLYFV